MINQQDIPLVNLALRHDELGQKCEAQGYPLRSSFYQYLDERYGRDALLKIAYSEDIVDSKIYLETYNKPFAQLEGEWREGIVRALTSTVDWQQRTQAYFEKVRAKGNYVCKAGQDY